MPDTADEANELNMFNLHGKRGLMVGLMTAGIDGRPSMSFHDEATSAVFHGDGVAVEATRLGRMYTVRILDEPDAGSVTFSVLIPSFDTAGPLHVETIGIRTMHREPTRGVPALGQQKSYRSYRLRGTATSVQS